MVNRIFAFITVLLVLFSCADPAIGIHVIEMEICTNLHNQTNPDVLWPFVIWQDNRDGDWDIYAYDLDRQAEYAICTADGNQINPSVGYGYALDESIIIIAWQDDRNGNNDIYGYKLLSDFHDLGFGSEIAICTDPCDQQNPTSAGSYICWQDNRNGNWDIYAKLYDEVEPNEVVICGSPGDQIKPDAIFDTVWSAPAPYYGRVIWQDNRNGDWDIYGHDLRDQNDFLVCIKDGNQTNPSCGSYGFTWQDDRNANNDAYASMCLDNYCSESFEIAVCTDPNSQIHPGFSEDAIVWQDDRNGGWDIYGYRTNWYYPGTEFIVSAGDEDRLSPAIDEWGYCVVWQDRRNGNDDIYAATLCLRGSDSCLGCTIELFDDEPYFGTTLYMSPTYIDTPTGHELLTSTCGFNDFIDAWHTYQPAVGGPVTITTEGSSLDTVLSVFNSCLTNYPDHQPPIELACNDDYCLEHAGSKVTLDAVKGKTYYIRVSGYNDQRGDYRIVVKRGAATDPIKSDLNGNGKVDWFDFAIFASEWLMSNTQ